MISYCCSIFLLFDVFLQDKQVNSQQYMSSVLTNGMLAAALNQVAYQTQPIPYQTHRAYGKVQDWKRRGN